MTSKTEFMDSTRLKPFKAWMLTFGWLTIVVVVIILTMIARSCEEEHMESLFAEYDAPVINTDSLSLADSVYTCIFLLRIEHSTPNVSYRSTIQSCPICLVAGMPSRLRYLAKHLCPWANKGRLSGLFRPCLRREERV